MKIHIISLLFLFILTACMGSSTDLIKETPIVLIPTEKLDVVLFSPDKTMRLQSSDWKNYQIIEKNGNIIWSFSYDINKFGKSESSFFWYAGYIPVYWSEDGRYIYLTCLHNNEDSSTKYFGNTFIDGQGIFKVDVKNKKLIDVIPELRRGYYAFIFTSDGKNLLYADQTETPVKIRKLNLDSNQEQILLVGGEKIFEMGSFGWSPHEDKLFFITLEIVDNERLYSLNFLDMETLKVVTIIENYIERFQFVLWTDDLIRLKGSDSSIWELNPISKQLSIIATKTPYPLVTLTPNE